MEGIRIAEADTLDLESGFTAEIIGTDVDSLSPKLSSSKEIEYSEGKRLNTSNSDHVIGGQNPLEGDGVAVSNKGATPPLSSGGRELCNVSPSPSCIETSSASDQTEDLEILSNCETPTDSIFNSFAPGPEELALAPKKKIRREFEIPARRQLKFDDCCDLEEKVESVCESFLELIVSPRVNLPSTEDVVEDGISNGSKTPSSAPLLMGIADTCPDAPMRPASKSRRLDQSSSRKLEFESSLI